MNYYDDLHIRRCGCRSLDECCEFCFWLYWRAWWPGAAYLAAIVLVNWMFTQPALRVEASWGVWSWGSLAVGAIFVLRDFADRSFGRHGIYVLVAIGTAITCAFGGPWIASGLGFAVSEVLDTQVFRRVAKQSFVKAVVLSSLVGVPVDTAIFLWGRLNPYATLTLAGFVVMTASKLVALLGLVFWAAYRPRPALETA